MTAYKLLVIIPYFLRSCFAPTDVFALPEMHPFQYDYFLKLLWGGHPARPQKLNQNAATPQEFQYNYFLKLLWGGHPARPQKNLNSKELSTFLSLV
jgi:hypothetical protein